MKKFYLFLFTCTLLGLNSAFAQTTYTSVASGNWNNPATWSPNGVPTVTSPVVLLGHTITVTADATCKSVTTKGAASGASTLSINSGSQLTLTGTFVVEPTNNYDNDTFLNGIGKLEVTNLQVGFATVNNSFPTTARLTTLYVDDLAELKINQDFISTTAVNGSVYNESRMRHRSGLIDLYGLLSVPAVGPGPSALGYRTDNLGQGTSTIIFRYTNPGIPTDVQRAPSFIGGTVEFRSTATEGYSFPSLAYKNVVLNSNRTFTSGGSSTSIISGGRFVLKLGVFASSAANQLRISDGVTVVRSAGSIAANNNSRPRLAALTFKYNVIYEQHTAVITTGRELLAYHPDNATIKPIKAVQINTTNGISCTNSIEVESLVINTGCTIGGSGKIDITEVLHLPNTATVHVADNQIKLVSTINNTARIGQLTNGTTINGKVIVERFLPNNQRAWRLLTAPVKGGSNNTVWENWQNNGVYTGADLGVDLWGPDGTLQAEDDGNTLVVTTVGNGLSLINNSSYNLRTFNNTTGLWSNVTNTVAQPLFTSSINQGFLLFGTNPFLGATDLAGIGSTGSTPTRISASGNLITGDVNFPNITSNRFYLIGNPYASPINFQSIIADSGNTGLDKVWMIDPTIGFGSYVTWDAIAGYSNSGTSFSGNTILQSGQAFFVRAVSGTTTLTIKELHKSDSVTNTTINKNGVSENTTAANLFRILLEKEVTGVYVNRDGCVAAFYDGGSNSLDVSDGRKLSNPGENLALVNTNFPLSIEHRAPIEDNDFLTVRISEAVTGINYKLKVYTENFTYGGNAYLQDLFTGSTVQIPLDGSLFEYPFQVTNNSESTGNRFKIRFNTDAPLNLTELVTPTFTIAPNPANSQDSLQISFYSGDVSGNYSYKIFSISGQLVDEGRLATDNSAGAIQLRGKLTTGLYFIQLQSDSNYHLITKKLIIK